MTDRLQKLLAVADHSEQLELKMANKGLVLAMRNYNERPGKQAKEDYEAARDLFESICARLVVKYFPDQAPVPEGERFKNRKQAFDWLQSQGHKVSRGKFYGDCDEGFPVVHQDGTVSRFQVLQYAQQLRVERSAAAPGQSMADDDARKLKAQADQEEMKAERMRREHDTEWLHADEAWAAVASLVGTLKDAMIHHFHAAQGELVHLAGGDPARAPELFEGCEEILARAFNEVSSGGAVEGIFDKDG